jgi:hypothetical protein
MGMQGHRARSRARREAIRLHAVGWAQCRSAALPNVAAAFRSRIYIQYASEATVVANKNRTDHEVSLTNHHDVFLAMGCLCSVASGIVSNAACAAYTRQQHFD